MFSGGNEDSVMIVDSESGEDEDDDDGGEEEEDEEDEDQDPDPYLRGMHNHAVSNIFSYDVYIMQYMHIYNFFIRTVTFILF